MIIKFQYILFFFLIMTNYLQFQGNQFQSSNSYSQLIAQKNNNFLSYTPIHSSFIKQNYSQQEQGLIASSIKIFNLSPRFLNQSDS